LLLRKATQTNLSGGKRNGMEIVRNKASGKYFILITDYENGTGLLVTPQGEVKRLELHLFDAAETIDPQGVFRDRLFSAEQIDKYKEYLETLQPRG